MASPIHDTFTMFPKLPKEIRLMIWERALPGPRVVNLKQRKLKKTIGEWEIETGNTWPPPPAHIQGEDGDVEDDHIIVDLRESSRWQRGEKSSLTRLLGGNLHDENAYKEGQLIGWVSDCPDPEILTVCREAFEIVTKSYHKIFSSLDCIPSTWFYFELDTLYLRYDDFSAYFSENGVWNITDELTDSGFMLMDKEVLRRVKNLAILFPNSEQELADISAEEVMTQFLEMTGALEKLYLVVKDYQVNDDDAKALAITDPIDFDATMAEYECFDPSLWHYDIQVPKAEFIKHWEVQFDLEVIQAMLEDDLEKGVSPWKIPTIEEKAIFTRGMVEEMENMRRRCQERMDEEMADYRAWCHNGQDLILRSD